MKRRRLSGPRPARRRDKLTVHLYALCWNEARMLPYFFKHYDPIVDQYFIADHDSTDGSTALLRRHPRVSLSRFVCGPSFVESATAHYNACWKPSRQIADWVFVVNIDEQVHHRRLRGYLRSCTKRGISVVRPAGYEMVAPRFPTSSRPLARTVRYGARSANLDKPQIFDPTRIDEINFQPGRHGIAPIGHVVYPAATETKLLHFKRVGTDYVVQRHEELRSVFPQQDLDRGWGYQYAMGARETLDEWRRFHASAVQVL